MTDTTTSTTPTAASDAREEHGRQLARAAQIRRVGRHWAVSSQSHAAEHYLVDVESAACTCPDFEERRGTCKHQHAVLFWIAWGRDVGADGSVMETVTLKRKTYAQPSWRLYNDSQTHEREYVERLLRALRGHPAAGEETRLGAPPPAGRGRDVRGGDEGLHDAVEPARARAHLLARAAQKFGSNRQKRAKLDHRMLRTPTGGFLAEVHLGDFLCPISGQVGSDSSTSRPPS